jgi:hypothetical protein
MAPFKEKFYLNLNWQINIMILVPSGNHSQRKRMTPKCKDKEI